VRPGCKMKKVAKEEGSMEVWPRKQYKKKTSKFNNSKKCIVIQCSLIAGHELDE
jgi:hypothetical protein